MAGLFVRSFRTLSIAALSMAAVIALAAVPILDNLYEGTNGRALGESARALASLYAARSVPAAGDFAGDFAGGIARDFAREAAAESGIRVTIVRGDGSVAADSAADSTVMENHASRPEIAAALEGRVASASRRSATVGMESFYAAAPVPAPAGSPREVLRISVELPSLAVRLAPALWGLAAALLFVAAAAAAAAAVWSRGISAPLARLAALARGFAGREPDSEADNPFKAPENDRNAPEEIRVLGAALAHMAAELAQRVRAAKEEGLEKGAILDGIAEAVLSLDAELAIRLANPAARELFRLGSDDTGKALLSFTRSTELQAAVARCLRTGERTESEVALYGERGERWFQITATPLPSLPGGTGSSGGAVLVLNDISRLRRLERVRKDFVANVSHELRTPIQLVKGFAETLLDGALQDPARAGRFVSIIGRNAGRMESLIDDLLSLAALEQDGRTALPTERVEIAPILAAAVEANSPGADEKGMAVSIDCPDGLEAAVNAGLLEQAVSNLVGNAVKYSKKKAPVSVSARAEGSELVLEVRDRGFGITAKDLPRIFERFYRVDKARSRELGGTGLGLAIVRHIALAHGGSVSAESWEGEGSRFTLRLPLQGPGL